MCHFLYFPVCKYDSIHVSHLVRRNVSDYLLRYARNICLSCRCGQAFLTAIYKNSNFNSVSKIRETARISVKDNGSTDKFNLVEQRVHSDSTL